MIQAEGARLGKQIALPAFGSQYDLEPLMASGCSLGDRAREPGLPRQLLLDPR